ncbi:MAG: TetR/AcrR family transcriptional regulator [Acidobacteria bacterium]|nr:TetR/AcrR family transcriptional regulator [Acidobacteriota bacterium]
MGIAERRAREKDQLRLKILSAASELFLNEGFEAVSMRKIADRIEYAASTIYLYFKNKDELIAGICTDTFEILIERLSELEQRGLAPMEELEGGLRCYIKFGLENPHQYRLVFNNPFPDDHSHEMQEANGLGLQALQFLARCIDRCRRSGDLAPGDALSDAMVVWMCVHGVTSVIITDHGKHGMPWPSEEAIIDRGVELIVRGLGYGSA